jgi:TolB protein
MKSLKYKWSFLLVAGVIIATAAGTPVAAMSQATLLRVMGQGNVQPNFNIYGGGLSGDGRYVAFSTEATNIVPSDTNGVYDEFIYDQLTQRVERIMGHNGEQLDEPTGGSIMTDDGKYLLYESSASQLVSPAFHECGPEWRPFSCMHAFLYNRERRQSKLLSITPDGRPITDINLANLSSNGRFLVFSTFQALAPADTDANSDLYIKDIQRNTIKMAADDTGWRNFGYPSVSADGRYVTFKSDIPLIPEDHNNEPDIYVRDLHTGIYMRANVASDGSESEGGDLYTDSPRITSDGNFITFRSDASNLVPGDTNGTSDIFVFDMRARRLSMVSVTPRGEEGNAMSFGPSISSNGRYVAFGSDASNLVPGDTNSGADIFVYDRYDHHTKRVSVAINGTQASSSIGGFISADGHSVAFSSFDSNLVPGDTNNYHDLFVYSDHHY